jgi:aminopeptidase N
MAEATEAQIRAEKLFVALMKDSKANPVVRAKAKELFTDVEFPEDQIDPMMEPLRAETSSIREELAALRKEREEEREARALESQKTNLEQALTAARSRYNLTDDGFDKMVSRMKETGNYTDADAAAAWVAQSAPKPVSARSSYGPQDIDLFGSGRESADERVRLLHTNPERFFDSEVESILSEMAA